MVELLFGFLPNRLAADDSAPTVLFCVLSAHAAGDLVLRTVAQRMQAHCGPFDVLGRIGGDEFVVGLFGRPGSGVRRAADRFSSDLRAAAAAPVTHGEHRIEVCISVGVAHTTGGTHLADLLADADADLYERKRARTRVADRRAADPEQFNRSVRGDGRARPYNHTAEMTVARSTRAPRVALDRGHARP